MKRIIPSLLVCLLICVFAGNSLAKDFLVTDYGAKPGPGTMNTGPINEAIEACYRYGGDRVVIPAGVFRSGILLMKENVELHLEMGAVLLASTALKDLPLQSRPAYHSQKDLGGWRGLKPGSYISDPGKVKEDEKGYPQPTVWKELPSSALFIRHAKNIQINGLILHSEKTDPRIPVIAADVRGLQIQNIGKTGNSGAGVFFKGWNVHDIAIDTPLAWSQKVTELFPPSKKLPGKQEYSLLTKVKSIPGLIAFWDFKEQHGANEWISVEGNGFTLKEKGPPVKHAAEGPVSGYSIELNGSNYLSLPYEETGALNVSDNAVTVIAWVKWAGSGTGFVGGMWNEYQDGGKRQYGLFVSLPHYNGADQVCGHVSKTGKPTPPFPYSIDYSASPQAVPKEKWACVAFTYDGKYIKSYLNGIFEVREPELIRHTKGFKGYPDGLTQRKNPYYFPDGIGNNGSDFTVGAVLVGGSMGNFFKGNIGGLSIFDRALTDDEMKRIAIVSAD